MRLYRLFAAFACTVFVRASCESNACAVRDPFGLIEVRTERHAAIVCRECKEQERGHCMLSGPRFVLQIFFSFFF